MFKKRVGSVVVAGCLMLFLSAVSFAENQEKANQGLSSQEIFEKARQEALLSRCRLNMKQLIFALRMYVVDYGKFPDRLSDLYSDYAGSLKLFTCPVTKEEITNKEEIDTKSSYEYRGKGLAEEIIEKELQRIILIEKNYNHTIDGKPVRYVGYADGHVMTSIELKAKNDKRNIFK